LALACNVCTSVIFQKTLVAGETAWMSGNNLLACREDSDVNEFWKTRLLQVIYKVLILGDNQEPTISWKYIGFLASTWRKLFQVVKKQVDN
jgi:hypothetical protein